jgi:hypothetical protein
MAPEAKHPKGSVAMLGIKRQKYVSYSHQLRMLIDVCEESGHKLLQKNDYN